MDGSCIASRCLTDWVPACAGMTQEVGALYDTEAVAEFENGFAHADAKRFGLGATRNGAAVVAAEYDDGFVCEVRAEEPLAAHEEVVAIYQGIHISPTFVISLLPEECRLSRLSADRQACPVA